MEYPLILATKSKARADVLKNLCIRFEVVSVDIDEEFYSDPIITVKNNSRKKMANILDKVARGTIITLDTVIYINNMVLGKPSTYEEAYQFLKLLSGKWHEVYTGLDIMNIRYKYEYFFYEKTRVKFRSLLDEDIDWYISIGEPFLKAGGYSIQGFGSLFIERLDGCFYNVVGIPVSRLADSLSHVGIDLKKYVDPECVRNRLKSI